MKTQQPLPRDYHYQALALLWGITPPQALKYYAQQNAPAPQQNTVQLGVEKSEGSTGLVAE